MENPITSEEIQAIRLQTRGCSEMIHFNNAGASLPPDIVVDTVIDYLKEEAQKGGYETEAKYLDRINAVYGKIAGFINAETEEIALFENASAAWGTAFKGLQFEDGDEIITSEMEYVTNLIGLVDAQKAAQIKVTVIPNDENGTFRLNCWRKASMQKPNGFSLPMFPLPAAASCRSRPSANWPKNMTFYICSMPARARDRSRSM